MPPKRSKEAASGVSRGRARPPAVAKKKPRSAEPEAKRSKKASASTNNVSGQQSVQAATFPRRLGEVARLPPADNVSADDSIVNRHAKVALSDVGEQLVISFLSFLPDRLRVERVCKRWRWLSQDDVPIHEMDLSKGVRRNVTKNDVIRVLQRANGQLTRLVLPDLRVDDLYFRQVVGQKNLRFFRAHRCVILYPPGEWISSYLLILYCGLGCQTAEKTHLGAAQMQYSAGGELLLLLCWCILPTKLTRERAWSC